MRMLLIEEDAAARRLLRDAFVRERFLVDALDDCSLTAEHATRGHYDLVVMSHHLNCDGVAVCRNIRDAHRDVPVMVLVDARSDNLCSRLLDAGADDCVLKPIEPLETMARVRALLRRGRTRHLSADMDYGPLHLDPHKQVIALCGQPLDLSATEYRLLRFLMLRAETIVTREELLQHVWGGTLDSASNTPDVYLSYLRQKLAFCCEHLIHTVRGLGYTLRQSSQQDFDVSASESQTMGSS